MESNKIEYIDNLPSSLHLLVKSGTTSVLTIANFTKGMSSNIIIDVEKDADFVGVFADFCLESEIIKTQINLLGEGAKTEWHLSSLSSSKQRKEYQIDVAHKANKTMATVSNYGIAREESFLKFAGTSHIENNAHKSQTKQEARIVVFDPAADALASPALRIDNNDVEASHAAIVGRLNEQHLFYLASRGIPLSTAKRLIALGYLKPIENYFDSEDIKKRIDAAIERGFLDVRS